MKTRPFKLSVPIFSTFVFVIVLAAAFSFFGKARADSPLSKRATALCTDVRTLAAATYSGQELVTQDGDSVTVEYLPDRMTGFAGNVISYERITRGDALQLGFKIEAGMSLYMLHGDEELPSEYVLLPEHMGDIATGRFQALYGTCDDTGAYDPAQVTRMSCVLK